MVDFDRGLKKLLFFFSKRHFLSYHKKQELRREIQCLSNFKKQFKNSKSAQIKLL